MIISLVRPIFPGVTTDIFEKGLHIRGKGVSRGSALVIIY